MKNTKGFALVEALLIFVIIGALAGVGWYVYQRQNTDEGDDSYTYGTNVPAEPVQEESTVPEGYTAYTNEELGISFYYPEEWGEIIDESKTDFYLFNFSNVAGLNIGSIYKNLQAEPPKSGSYIGYGGYSLSGEKIQLKTFTGEVAPGAGDGYQLNESKDCVFINDKENLVVGPSFHATCNVDSGKVYGINFYYTVPLEGADIEFTSFSELINTVKVQ